MATFTISLANKNILVTSLFEETKDFCKDYLSSGDPDFSVTITMEDIAAERIINDRQMALDGNCQSDFSDSYIETLALYRKITSKLLPLGTLLMHGCVIAYKGKAYIFTAKSGVGKTTHSRLWLENIPGSYILNGDKPLISFEDDGVYACGTPWMGKEGAGVNEILPLDAVCFLERSKENVITKVSFADTYPKLLSQIHIPEGNNTLPILNLVKKMASINFFRLGCNMDKEAAYVSCAAITGDKLTGEELSGPVMSKTYEEVLDEYGYLYWKTVGISMEPLIREGRDTVIIKKRPKNRLKKYDVALFVRPNITGRGAYVLHRVLKVNDDGTYFIIGDNLTSGEIVPEERVIGVLTGIVRHGKKNTLKGPKYKLYVHLWCAPYRIRIMAMKLKQHVRYRIKKLFS